MACSDNSGRGVANPVKPSERRTKAGRGEADMLFDDRLVDLEVQQRFCDQQIVYTSRNMLVREKAQLNTL